jgi:hypothetical protein
MTRLDREALRQGGTVSLVFAVPFAVLSRLFAGSDDSSGFAALLWLMALAGFVVGAGVAAWLQRSGLPLVHGMVAAGGSYLTAQIVFIVVKLARGGDVNWLSALFTFTFVLVAGLIGGALGSMLQRRGIAPRSRAGR